MPIDPFTTERLIPPTPYREYDHGRVFNPAQLESKKEFLRALDPSIQWELQINEGGVLIFSTELLAYNTATLHLLKLRDGSTSSNACLLRIRPVDSLRACLQINVPDIDPFHKNLHSGNPLYQISPESIERYVSLLNNSDLNAGPRQPKIVWVGKCNPLGEQFVVSPPLSYSEALSVKRQFQAKLPLWQASLLSIEPSASSANQYHITIKHVNVEIILTGAKQKAEEKLISAASILPATSAPMSHPQPSASGPT